MSHQCLEFSGITAAGSARNRSGGGGAEVSQLPASFHYLFNGPSNSWRGVCPASLWAALSADGAAPEQLSPELQGRHCCQPALIFTAGAIQTYYSHVSLRLSHRVTYKPDVRGIDKYRDILQWRSSFSPLGTFCCEKFMLAIPLN